YRLFYNTQNGSGYDVASALCDTPILFQRNGLSPVVQPVIWQPAFRDQLAFVYRGAKQNSTQEVTRFVRNTSDKILPVSEVNAISEALLTCDDIEGFEQLMYEHERLLSGLLEQPTVKAQLFPDYPGLIKSLGAWGGDFMLITKRDGYQAYFERKGLSLILDWEELLLHKF
ncbi:MAG: hypothetical protein LAT76_11190, partial [Schleiferiaceae bacterium]|nr:hypothetical protein [Schleiferiaceae bacterium]